MEPYRIGNDPSRNMVVAEGWTREHREEVLSSFRKAGEKYETFVGRALVEKFGGAFTMASPKENMRDHIDIWWTSPKGMKISIDVKGPKKTRRYDSSPDNDRTWIEILNTAGGPGWLDGKEQMIAFVREGTEKEILFVDRAKLSDFVKEKVKNSKIFEYNTGNSYDLYTRAKWGNNDMCVIVPFKDMEPFVILSLKPESC